MEVCCCILLALSAAGDSNGVSERSEETALESIDEGPLATFSSCRGVLTASEWRVGLGLRSRRRLRELKADFKSFFDGESGLGTDGTDVAASGVSFHWPGG